MGKKASWKQRQLETHTPTQDEASTRISFKAMLKYTVIISGKNYFSLLLPFLLFIVIMALVKLLIVPNINWMLYQEAVFIDHLAYLVNLDPTYNIALPPLENNAYYLIQEVQFFANILLVSLDAIPQYLGILATAALVNYACNQKIAPNQKSPPVTLRSSFSQAFRRGKAGPAITVVILLSILVPLGLAMLIIPGILVLVLMMFSLQVVPLENAKPLDILRVAYRHTKGEKTKILITVILGLVITTLWNDFVVNPIVVVPDWSVYNPLDRNWLVIFLSFLEVNFMEALVFPFISVLYTMLYLQIKSQHEKIPTKAPTQELRSAKPPPAKALRTQQMRRCPHCARAIPATSHICPHCKQPVT